MSEPRDRETAGVWQEHCAAGMNSRDLDAEVHVWRARRDGLPPDIVDSLSVDEQARAARFRDAADRSRFIAARALLRRILAASLGGVRDPAGRTLRFGYGQAGKPFLIDCGRLRFNLSHAGDLILIAVTRAGEVGIDVEQIRPIASMDGIALLVFDDTERLALQAAAPADATPLFHRLWTRKEALIKALGIGMAALQEPRSASLRHAADAWTLMSLPHLDGYAGALAWPRAARAVRLWSWPNTADMRSDERRAVVCA